MTPHLLWALGAGLTSAIVFASATTGPLAFRLILWTLVPLPIALAGFAANPRTAVLAASFGTLTLGALATLTAGAFFAVTLAFPAAFLVYLALLHRDQEGAATEWYPVGRIVFASALLGGAFAAAGLMLAGSDIAKLRAYVSASLETMMNSGFAGMPVSSKPDAATLAQFTETVLSLLPGVSAAFWMSCALLCLWIAGRVTLASGQLARPWPDLAAVSLPTGTPLLLGAILAGSFLLDGVARLAAFGFAGAIYAAYVLVGLAVLHFTTRGRSWRGGALAAVYIVLIVMNSGASLILALLGLLDTLYPLRRLPPSQPTPSV
jgi:hypothetical protein